MTIEPKRIEKEMHDLEKLLRYSFKDISLLSKAMRSVLVPRKEGEGENHKEYSNEVLATIGDAILKLILADNLYRNENIATKGDITKSKELLEKNLTLHNVVLYEGLIKYAYNDLHFYKDSNIPEHEKVACNDHDAYAEAIVAAIFYDSDFDTTRRWVLEWLAPLLDKYK